jgi:hypothetical protein
MRRDKRLLTTLWRGLRAIVRRPASPDPPASREPIVTVIDLHPGAVTIEPYSGDDPHDRWYHPIN